MLAYVALVVSAATFVYVYLKARSMRKETAEHRRISAEHEATLDTLASIDIQVELAWSGDRELHVSLRTSNQQLGELLSRQHLRNVEQANGPDMRTH